MEKHSCGLYNFILIVYVFGAFALLWTGIGISEYIFEYWFIYSTYILCGSVFMYLTFYRGAYLYEPIVLIGILIFLTYSVAPLLCIALDDADCRGFDVMDGCIEATLIYILSFFSLLLGYYSTFFGKNQSQLSQCYISWDEAESDEFRHENKSPIILGVSYFWWTVGFVFFMIYFIRSGFSIQYVLSLGLSGEADTSEAVSGTLDFLYNFRFGMIAAIFYLWRYGKKKVLYLLMYLITFIMFMSYGYRNMLVEMIVAPLVFYSILNKKPPKISTIMKLCGVIILMISFVEMIRSSVRMGTGASSVDWSGFNLMTIYYAFQGNFDLYKTLYGIVSYIPSQHGFTWGQQLIWMTVTFLIPRSFWPGKPTSVLDSLMPYIVGEQAVRGHMAMGTLAEYYGEFGILGCIICCFILGKGVSYTKKWYESTDRTEDTMIAYSVLYPMFMLLAVRGYMPLNFMHILFIEIPVISVAIVKHTKI